MRAFIDVTRVGNPRLDVVIPREFMQSAFERNEIGRQQIRELGIVKFRPRVQNVDAMCAGERIRQTNCVQLSASEFEVGQYQKNTLPLGSTRRIHAGRSPVERD